MQGLWRNQVRHAQDQHKRQFVKMSTVGVQQPTRNTSVPAQYKHVYPRTKVRCGEKNVKQSEDERLKG